MKQISLFIPLLGTLLLSGCAGTNSDFECDATTSDIQQQMQRREEVNINVHRERGEDVEPGDDF